MAYLQCVLTIKIILYTIEREISVVFNTTVRGAK